MYLLNVTGGGLGGVLTSRQDMGLPDDGGKQRAATVCPKRVNTLWTVFRLKGSTQNWYTLFSKAKRKYFLLSGCISTWRCMFFTLVVL